MTDDQLATVRDSLMAELATPKSSAAKFEPALLGWRNRNTGVKQDAQGDLDRARSEVKAIVTASHERAVSNLALILAQPEFVGLTAQQIYDQNLLLDERPILQDFPLPTEMQELIEGVLSTLKAKPADLTVFDDGTVVTDSVSAAAEISARIGKAVGDTGKTDQQLMAARTEKRETGRTPPLISIAWQGIPYTYNTPPVEVIQLALDRRGA